MSHPVKCPDKLSTDTVLVSDLTLSDDLPRFTKISDTLSEKPSIDFVPHSSYPALKIPGKFHISTILSLFFIFRF